MRLLEPRGSLRNPSSNRKQDDEEQRFQALKMKLNHSDEGEEEQFQRIKQSLFEQDKKPIDQKLAIEQTPNERMRREAASRDDAVIHKPKNFLQKTGSVLGKIDDNIQGFFEAGANAATFGLHNKLNRISQNATNDPKLKKMLQRDIDIQDSVAGKVGEFAGMAVPIGGAYKAVTKLGAPAIKGLTKGIGNKVAQKATERLATGAAAGTLYGAGKEGLDAALDTKEDGKQTFGQHAKNVAIEGALFGGADVALFGAGKGLKAIADKTGLTASVSKFLSRNKPPQEETTRQLLALPIATVPKSRRISAPLPKGEGVIHAEGPVKQFQIEPPKVEFKQRKLTPMNATNTLDSVMAIIKPIVEQRIAVPARRDQLVNYISANLDDVPTQEIWNMPMKDLQELGQEIRNNISVHEVATQVARELGHDLPKLLDGQIPSVRQKSGEFAQQRVYGVPAPGVGIKKPDAFRTSVTSQMDAPVQRVGRSPNVPQVEIIPPVRRFEQPLTPMNRSIRETAATIDNTAVNGQQTFRGLPSSLRPASTQSGEITRQTVINNMKTNLGVTIRTGRFKADPTVRGIFKTKPEVIRTRQAGDLQVISHEIGHHLDKQFKLANPQFDNELLALGQRTSAPNYSQGMVREEGIAEYIRLHLTDPQIARQSAPQFSNHFDSVIPPNVKAGLQATQKNVDTWISQGEALQFRGQVNRTGTNTPGIKEKIEKLYTRTVDQFDPLYKAEKAITGKIGDATNSLYKKARLSVGAPKKAAMILEDLQNSLKPLEKFGFTTKDLGDYAAAKHAFELEQQGIQSGFTPAQIDAVLRKFDTPEMNVVQKQVVAYSDKLLDILVKSERITQEAVDAMRTKYKDYVPFYRFFDEDIASGLGSGKGFANVANPIKKLKGSSRDIIDPLESLVKNTFAVVNAAERNKVGLELSKLADIEGAGKFVERLDKTTGSPKEGIVTVYEKGQPVQYQLEPELYRSILQMDEQASNTVIKILAAPASVLRAGATLTPEFILRNPIRDQFQAFVVSNYGYNPLVDLPKGIFHVFRKSTGVYKQWVENGGGYGQYVSQDRDHLREELKKLARNSDHPLNKGFKTVVDPRQWVGILRRLSEISEEATKVGEFNRGIKKAKATPQEAAFQSRDLMDFGRVGTDTKQVNRVIAFFNANVQGKDRIIRAFKNNPVRTTTRAVTGITLPTIGLYILNETNKNEVQRERYKNTPQWMKDTFYIVPIPFTDELARIPKPFDLAPVFSSLPEQILRFVQENDPQAWDEFVGNTMKQFSIPYMLSGLTPVIENMTNYSFFTGGPIIPRRDQDLLPADQYGINTSLTARAIGKVTGSSPYKVDNLISGYGAGLGKYATSGIDKAIETTGFGNLPTREKKKWSELPVISAFTVKTSGGGQVMEDFYKSLDKKKKEFESAKRNKTLYKDLAKVKMLESASRAISEFRKDYREVQGSHELSAVEKRNKLDMLDERMNGIATKALGLMKER